MKKENKVQKKTYFRSLEQLEGSKEYTEKAHREFPEGASEMNNDWSRRNFMGIMGASIALAGLAGCRRPKEKIVPYVKPPEDVIPGIAQQYATTMSFGTSSYGIVVESHEGRPTKIEGNTLHSSTLGSSNAMIQASMLGLYDPDRSKKVLQNGKEKTFDDFTTFWTEKFAAYKDSKGEGLAVLSESFASPTLSRLKKQFEKVFPKATWAAYEAVSDENIYLGLKYATGKNLQPIYDYSQADVILSLDSDFTLTESEDITANAGFASGRNIKDENDKMNRLYVVETAFSGTGGTADHRLVIKQREIVRFVSALAKALSVKGSKETPNVELSAPCTAWLAPLVKDLISSKGKSLVVAGRRMPHEVHALVYAINKELENIDKSVKYVELQDAELSSVGSLKALTDRMNSGVFSTVLMLNTNPIYNAPADFKFASALKKVENRIHVGLYNDETAKVSTWHIPTTHYLENWSDARSVDGTASVVQPLIAPLFDGKSSVEMLSMAASGEFKEGHVIVKETWKDLLSGSFDSAWRKVLHDGVLAGSQHKTIAPNYKSDYIFEVVNYFDQSKVEGTEIVFASSPSVFDGRFANNGWMQELPGSVTRISWDNVAQVSKKTADSLGLKSEDLINIKINNIEIQMPLWVVPGTADDTVILELGYGRNGIGRIADKAGFDVYPIRTSEAMSYVSGATITATGQTFELANVQDHWSMEDRPIVREATKEDYEHHPEFAKEAVEHPPLESMWDDYKYDKGNQWGMAIDLTTCTGCSACTIACQSENNIPIVGKQEVRNGREMHWIRIDRYFSGDVDNSASVEMVHQPIACQQCEMAPCEQVCPVAATVHSDDGLNTMVYNRCIGTRYCANNCPYKVRRFNFFNFTKETPEIVKMAMNPDVTVRSRGVMEKCTYCVQRISKARIEAKKEDRLIVDGDIVVACQQACPANAIAFGDILDKTSNVYQVKARNRAYDLLGELNVRPRTSFLAKIRNLNPNMPKTSKSEIENT